MSNRAPPSPPHTPRTPPPSPPQSPPPAPTQKGILSYFSHTTDGLKPYVTFPAGTSNIVYSDRLCQVKDIRGRESTFSLEQHSFAFLKHETNVTNFKDKSQIEGLYLPEVEQLVRQLLGEEEVKKMYVFGWNIRSSHQNAGEMGASKPTTNPHIDQSPTGAIRRVHYHLLDEAEELLKGRFRILK